MGFPSGSRCFGSRPDKPVAHPWFGDEVDRLARIGFELVADLGHEHPQVVGLDFIGGSPYLFEQLHLGYELPFVPDQQLDHSPFGRSEPNLGSIWALHGLGGEVYDEVGGRHHGLLLGWWCGPAEGGSEPSEELAHTERLGDVVVCARIEGRDLVGLSFADGEDEDGHGGPATQTLDDLNPVDAGETEVEDDGVGSALGGPVQCLFASACGVDLVAEGLEVNGESPHDLGLVVDYENALLVGHPRPSERLVVVGRCAARAGLRAITMVVPPPGVSSMRSSLPMASRKPLDTAKPSPTPSPGWLSLRRWKGWNTSLRRSRGIPGPRSVILKSTRPLTCPADTETGVRGGDHLTAFSTRLAMTRSRSVGSVCT